MNQSAVVERRRRDPQLIGDLVARPAFLHTFQSAVNQLQAVFPSRKRRSFASNIWDAKRSCVSSQNRLLLVSGGRLCAMLARRLLCFNGECAVRDALRLGTSALSRRHFFKELVNPSFTTLSNGLGAIFSMAVHPTAPFLAIGRYGGTVDLCSSSSNTMLVSLRLPTHFVLAVAFHPSEPILATGSSDNTVRLWRVSFDDLSVECIDTLMGHTGFIESIAFHPNEPIFATASRDGTVKLWEISHDLLSATCVSTLVGHDSSVYSVVFHPTANLLATGSKDKNTKLWLLSHDLKSATCVATLEGHSDTVRSVAFHPTAPLLATVSEDNTVRLWIMSSDLSSAICIATLEGHRNIVYSVAFHPTAPILATGSLDCTAKLWLLSPDLSSANCVATLPVSGSVFCVEFDPAGNALFIGSTDGKLRECR